MPSNARRFLIVLVCLTGAAAVSAQQQPPHLRPGAKSVVLDVVVTGKSGEPVSGLQSQDFTVLDNKFPQPISSFQSVDSRSAYVELIIVVDAVNTDYEHLGYERDQVDKFLRADAGRLAFPTAVEILTDKGMQSQGEFSIDGNALSSALDQATVGLRTIRRSAGIYGAGEEYQISLQALHDLADRMALYPRRKMILWVSPGWPLLSGPNVDLDENQRQQIFSNIVSFSNQLRTDHITLYSIDPLGTSDVGGFATFYWKDFVKGIGKPNQAQAGDLALEVLATQSGGVALNSSNDVAALLQKCVSDIDAYYELSFEPAPDIKANQYHSIEIRVDKPGLTARTRQSYYSQP